MLREWMRAEGVSARLLARPDGERRLTNLMHLAELLHEAAASHPAPEALQRWLQTQRSEARRDEAAQLRLESDRNLVQVVTIHKSKGLEYPLVFCPLLWDGHTPARRGGEGVEYHDEDGDTVIDFRELDKPSARCGEGTGGAGSRGRDDAADLRGADARGAPLHIGGRPLPRAAGQGRAECDSKLPRTAQLAGGRRRPVAAGLAEEQARSRATSKPPGPRWRSGMHRTSAWTRCPLRRAWRWHRNCRQRNSWLRCRHPRTSPAPGGSAATARWRLARATKARPSTMTCASPARRTAGPKLKWRPTTSCAFRAARWPANACMRCSSASTSATPPAGLRRSTRCCSALHRPCRPATKHCAGACCCACCTT